MTRRRKALPDPPEGPADAGAFLTPATERALDAFAEQLAAATEGIAALEVEDEDDAPPPVRPSTRGGQQPTDLRALRNKVEKGITQLRAEGIQPTSGALADLYNVDDSTVRRWLRRLDMREPLE